MKLSLNLNKQVLIIILISVMVTFASVLFVNNKLFLGVFKDKFHEKISILGKEFSKAASLALLLNRKDLLVKRAESILKDYDIVGVEVVDKRGKKMISRGRASGYKVIFPIIVKKFSSENLFEGSEQSFKLGQVVLFYTRENIKNLMFKIFFLSFSISFLIAIIIFLFAYKTLSKNFIIPLRFLTENIDNEEKLEKEYNRKYHNSSVEIRTLYSSFLNMIKQLKENYKKMAQQKSLAEIGNFSLTVAHEIKNPLGIIKGAFDIFKKENIDDQTKQEMVKYIEDEIVRIDKLVKDFLTMSKNININLSEYSINEIINKLVEKSKVNFPDVSFNFAYKKKVSIVTDKNMLIQIILNLIKNSIEAKATVVNILLGTDEKKWFIKVIDNGIGIDDVEKEKIFEPFYTSKPEGTGIGLTYVVKAIYQLGWAIDVVSEKGKGTTFVISGEI